MSTWNAGYTTDIAYTFGYYAELNPQRIKLAFLHAGLAFPEVGAACELGFGQGLSTNLHAAASVTHWQGTDFNPAQAAFAQALAADAGAGAKLYDEAFDEFAHRTDLPEFDYIGLHGIWSWISDSNRHVIVDFIRRKLKVGGVLYISYNTMPGWAAFAPMRHLMTEHAEVLGAEGRGIVSRVDGALEFAEKLLATNPVFSRANPLVGERLKKMKDQNRQYLAHEYFNSDWHPMHFATMANWLQAAKLQYACSANLIDHVEAVNLTPEQQAFMREIPDAMFRETTRDFMVNQQFRKDYWVKGARKLSPLAQAEALRALRVVLTSVRADVPLKVQGAAGEASLSDGVYGPVLAALADHSIRSLAQLEPVVAAKGVSFAQLVQALVILVGMGHVALAQDDAVISKARKTSQRINQALCLKARENGDLNYLASPVTGGGVHINRFNQLFLLALGQGKKTPAELAQGAWQWLGVQNQRLIKEGKTLATPEENMAELTELAEKALRVQLPIWKALGLV